MNFRFHIIIALNFETSLVLEHTRVSYRLIVSIKTNSGCSATEAGGGKGHHDQAFRWRQVPSSRPLKLLDIERRRKMMILGDPPTVEKEESLFMTKPRVYAQGPPRHRATSDRKRMLLSQQQEWPYHRFCPLPTSIPKLFLRFKHMGGVWLSPIHLGQIQSLIYFRFY